MNSKDPHLMRFLHTVLEEKSAPGSRTYFDDPTVMGYVPMFEFSGPNSPLFNETEQGESAIRYLKAIGEPERAAALQEFKRRLRDLVVYYPYFFQSLKGLGEIYDYSGSGGSWGKENRELEFDTLESIDMRIGNLVELHQFACFDPDYWREMLPANLKRFKFHIIVSETRRFRTFVRSLTQAADTDRFGMRELNDRLRVFVYTFAEAEFNFNESQNWLEEIKNGENDGEATNSFRISCSHPSFSPRLGFVDLMTGQTPETAKPQPGSPGSPTNTGFLGKAEEFLSPYEQTASQFFKREADIFLGRNDPAYVASRVANQTVVAEFDKQFSKLLFGNVFNKYRSFDFAETVTGDIRSDVEAMLNRGKSQKGQVAWRDKITMDLATKDLPAVMRDNVLGFDRAPFSTMLQQTLRASLGNVFKSEAFGG